MVFIQNCFLNHVLLEPVNVSTPDYHNPYSVCWNVCYQFTFRIQRFCNSNEYKYTSSEDLDQIINSFWPETVVCTPEIAKNQSLLQVNNWLDLGFIISFIFRPAKLVDEQNWVPLINYPTTRKKKNLVSVTYGPQVARILSRRRSNN